MRKLFLTFILAVLMCSNVMSQKRSSLDFGISYTGEIFSNLKGGYKTGTSYLHNVDLTFELDLENLFTWNGTRLFFYFLGDDGDIPNDKCSTVQGISNIAAPNTWKIYEFWLEKKFSFAGFSVLFGLFDLNSEFDNRETSSLFINPTHGIGCDYSQSGKNGPSIFPTTSLGFRLKIDLYKNVTFRTAVFDGVPGNPDDPYGTIIRFDKNDGVLVASELAYESGKNGSFDEDYGRYLIGFWTYSTKFNHIISGEEKKGNFGIYASVEKFLISEEINSDQGLAAFARIGYASTDFNFVDYCISGGVVYYGLFDNWDDDCLGLAFAMVHKNSELEKTSDSYEINIELTYEKRIFEWLSLQPDIQFVINPGIDQHLKNSFVIGLRTNISF